MATKYMDSILRQHTDPDTYPNAVKYSEPIPRSCEEAGLFFSDETKPKTSRIDKFFTVLFWVVILSAIAKAYV